MTSDSTPDPSRPVADDRAWHFASPAVFIAAAFALGIACAGSPPAAEVIAVRWIPALLLASSTCLLAGAALTRSRHENWAAAVALAGFVLAGASSSLLFPFRFPPSHVSHLENRGIDPSRPVLLQGRLLSDPVQTPSGPQFDVEATGFMQAPGRPSSTSPVNGKLRVRVSTNATDSEAIASELRHLRSGDAIEAVAQLRRPRVYANPGSFDFRHRAESIEDLYWEGNIERGAEFRRLSPPSERGAGRLAEVARRRVRRAIDRLYPPWSADGRYGAVLKAILIGDRSSLDSATLDHFRATGLYHLLVIAGLHVGLIAALALGLLRLVGLRRTPRYAVLLILLVGYALLVEQRAPTVRATLMLAAFVTAQLLGREYSALNSVGLAALLLLLVRPAWLFETGFQLSFCAALLIVGVAGPILRLTIEPYRRVLHHLSVVQQDAALPPRLAQFRIDLRMLVGYLQRRSSILAGRPEAARRLVVWPLGGIFRLAEILVLSAVLQIGLLLPMAETFHRITLAGVGLNALAVPLMAALLAVAIPTVALATVAPALAVWPARGLALIFDALFSVADMPHLPGWLSYRVPSPPTLLAVGFALALVAVALTLRRNRAALLLSCLTFVGCALMVATAPFPPLLPAGEMEITSLDCGGGEANLVVLPDRSTVLIGAGGAPRRGAPRFTVSQRWDPGENIVSPYLWSRRIRQLDVLIIADTNEGRLEGFGSILRNFRVRELWLAAGAPTPRSTSATESLNSILEEARRRGVQVRRLSGGDIAGLGGSVLQIIGDESAPSGRTEPGAGSAAVRIESGETSALIVGRLSGVITGRLADPNVSIESRLLVDDGPILTSAAGENLIGRVSPKLVVVAAGPSPRNGVAAIALLTQALGGGTRLLLTDRDGAITVGMRGSSVQVSTFRGGRLNLW